MSKKGVNGILIIGRDPARVEQLKRVVMHLNSTWIVNVDSFADAEFVVEKQVPEVLILELSDFSYGEFVRKIEPFILKMPGSVKTLLVEPEPTVESVVRASEIGVDGIIKAPVSHYTISTLLAQIDSAKG